MATKKKGNERCPLQQECEKKCEYKGHELDCLYYFTNANGDSVIDDQEVIRVERERAARRKYENELMDQLASEKEQEKDDCVAESSNNEMLEEDLSSGLDVVEVSGALSESARLDRVLLALIHEADDNPFDVEADITELKEDISVNGLLTPLTVCEDENGFRLISGHRRFKALCELHKNTASIDVPVMIVKPVLPEAERYMLIRANTACRKIDYNQQAKAVVEAEKCLVALKQQGYDFPGKLRKHVANLVKLSEAKVAKIKYCDEHLIPELKDVPDSRLNFDNRYTVAHWTPEQQVAFYNKDVKEKTGYLYNVNYYDFEIKSGKDPFLVPEKSSQGVSDSTADKQSVRHCRYKSGECGNAVYFSTAEKDLIVAPGLNFKCGASCCYLCSYSKVCPMVCKNAKESIYGSDRQLELFTQRLCLALKTELVAKGFDCESLDTLQAELGADLELTVENLFEDRIFSLSVYDFLWYCKRLEMTPNEVLSLVQEDWDAI